MSVPPPSTVLFFTSLGVASIPACLENPRRTLHHVSFSLPFPSSLFLSHILSLALPSSFGSITANLTVTFARADRRNFKSVNECGREQADRNPEAGALGELVKFRSLGIVPRDLDTPTAATEATVMTSFRGG